MLKDWLDERKVPYVLMRVDTTSGTEKEVRAVPKGWMQWDFDECTRHNDKCDPKCNTLNINLKGTGLVVIDCDDEAHRDEVLDMYPGAFHTLSSRRGLPHVWLKRHAGDDNKTTVKVDGKEIDYLYNNAFESKDSPIHNYVDEPPVFDSFVKKQPKPKKKSNKPRLQVVQEPGNQPTDFQTLVLNNVAVEHWDNRESWMKLVFAMQKEGLSADTIIKHSKRSARHQPGCVEDLLQDWDENQSPTWGTVEHYSRESDHEQHAAICANRPASTTTVVTEDNDDSSDRFLALKGVELCNGEVLQKDDQLHVWDRVTGLWVADGKGKRTRVLLAKRLDAWILSKMELLPGLGLDHKTYKEQAAQLLKAKDKIHSTKGLKNIYESFCDHIGDSDVEFDVHRPHFFVWSCGKVYDFESSSFVKLAKEDYVTMSTGYPYEQATDAAVAELEALYRQIHFDPDTCVPYMSVIVTACVGRLQEKFVVCTGSGGNGKGVVNELLTAVLGNYCYRGPVGVLNEPFKGGANPAVANMHLKRLTIFTEPEPGKKLNQSAIKAITGDSEINARQLYSCDTRTINHSTVIMECNELPKLSGKMDASMERRIVAIPFDATYTSNANHTGLLDGAPNIHLADARYKSHTWQQENRAALFELIRRFAVTHPECLASGVIVTEKVRACGKKYLESSNFALEWFRENYERAPEESCTPITAKDLFQHLKDSDEYRTLDRDEKKYWTKNRLVDHLKDAVPRGDYEEGQRKVDGKNYRNFVRNWKESRD